jgi:predicted nucleic acid-binding protein
MTAPVFVDTNVFIYALDAADRRKQLVARQWREALWKNQRGRVSFQVLQEFFVKVTQKWPDARDAARAEIRDLLAWRPVVVDAPLVERAWKLQDRYRLSLWDSLIAAAAKTAACRYLLTEDLQDGQDLDGVLVINPFRHDVASLDPGKHETPG